MTTTHFDCEPFPNTRIFAKTRKVRDGYRGVCEVAEWTAWNVNFYRYPSAVTRTTRHDALRDALEAAKDAARTGYVPAF